MDSYDKDVEIIKNIEEQVKQDIENVYKENSKLKKEIIKYKELLGNLETLELWEGFNLKEYIKNWFIIKNGGEDE